MLSKVFSSFFFPFYFDPKTNHPLGVICDFGLARAADSSYAVKNSKQVRNQVGLSPRYAAPEIFSQIENTNSNPVQVRKFKFC